MLYMSRGLVAVQKMRRLSESFQRNSTLGQTRATLYPADKLRAVIAAFCYFDINPISNGVNIVTERPK